jgi:hypothetical protein
MTNPESKAAAILGRKGGLSRSEAKIKAAKENGKKGGAPPKFKLGRCVAHMEAGCKICHAARAR